MRAITTLSTAILVASNIVSASAGPLDGNVAAGSVTIQGQNTPNTTIIQQTPRAIVNWRSFNLGANETVRFVQPDATSVILNRVTGNLGPSQIYGTLTANGRVFIVNPDGILIGAGAKIDTAGFLASVSDIRNEDFMLGNYRFMIPGRPDASIINLGRIDAHSQGFAALVAPGVRNDGVIVARFGTIALASANEFVLDFYGDRLIQLSVNDAIAAKVRDVATGQVLTSLVQNNGRLKANGGQVQLTAVTARQIVNAVVNNRGVIEADTVAQRGGKIILGAPVAKTKQQNAPPQNVIVSGTLSAKGKKKDGVGGYIEITGENVEVAAANINASGNIKGGTILIGGDLSGGQVDLALAALLGGTLEPKAIPAATNVTVDTLSLLNASALRRGDGGKIIVWADGTTNFAGLALNRGGDNAGNGGLLEISGKKKLTFAGVVDLRALKGKTGSLLLDPENVVIGNAPGSTMFISALQAALANANVVVTTNAAAAGDGDITIAGSINWSTYNSLTLNAHRHIVINDGVTISNTAAGNLTLNADSQRTGVGYVNFIGGAKIDFSASTGNIEILYNPPFGYAFPINYAPSVLRNVAVVNQFTAYMLVNNVNDLQNIQQNLTGTYALGQDVDAGSTVAWNGGAGFIPIGPAFQGIFDGKNFKIDRLRINSSEGAVFNFLESPAIVRNLEITNLSIVAIGAGRTAGLAQYISANTLVDNVYVSGEFVVSGGFFGGIVAENHGLISNSWSSIYVRGSAPYVGGIAALNTGSILRSHSNSDIQTTQNTGGVVWENRGLISHSFYAGVVRGQLNVGGLAASNTGTIVQSYSTASVNGAAGNTGGLVGYNFQGGLISESYSTGNVTASSGLVGGLVGANEHNSGWPTASTILRSYATGSINGSVLGPFTCYCGGLVGFNSAIISQSFATGDVTGYAIVSPIIGGIGGLVGYNFGITGYGIISESYATGLLTRQGNGLVGGLVALSLGGQSLNSYWDVTATGQIDSSGGIGIVTQQLKNALPAGFDSAVWGIHPAVNSGYPYLRWAFTPPPTNIVVPPQNMSLYATQQVQELYSQNFYANANKNVVTSPLPNGLVTSTSSNTQDSLAANVFSSAVGDAILGAIKSVFLAFLPAAASDGNKILSTANTVADLTVALDGLVNGIASRDKQALEAAAGICGTVCTKANIDEAVVNLTLPGFGLNKMSDFAKLLKIDPNDRVALTRQIFIEYMKRRGVAIEE